MQGKYHCLGIFFIVTVSTEVNGSMWAVDYWALLASELHMNVSTQISDRLRLIYILGHQCYDCRYNNKTCMNISSLSRCPNRHTIFFCSEFLCKILWWLQHLFGLTFLDKIFWWSKRLKMMCNKLKVREATTMKFTLKKTYPGISRQLQ